MSDLCRQGSELSPLDAFWHIANFFAPAIGVGAIASLLAKLLWRGSLGGVSWWRLGLWAVACCALILATGLVAFGRDGKMATYGLMVVGCAVTLWWVGFGARRR